MTSPSISKDTPVASAAAAATVVIAAPARPDTRVVRRSELVGWVTAGPAVRVVEAIGRPPCSGGPRWAAHPLHERARSEQHTSELQSLMRISYAVFCLKKKNTTYVTTIHNRNRKHNEH